MDVKTKIEMVISLARDISEKLGTLTHLGVLSFEEGEKIVETITNKQLEWLQNNDEFDSSFNNDDEFADYQNT